MILNHNSIYNIWISIYYNDNIKRALGVKCKIENFKTFRHILEIYAFNDETENVDFLNKLLTIENAKKANIILHDFNRIEEFIDQSPERSKNKKIVLILRSIRESRNLMNE